MSVFEPSSRHFREVLFFCLHLIGFRTCWSQEMLYSVSFLVNSCFKDRIRRGFHIALWLTRKNVSTTIIASSEKHGDCPDMPSRRRPDWIFAVPRLSSAFGGTSLVWCIMSCWNWVKPLQGIGIQRNWCVWTEHWRRNGHSTKRDTSKLTSSMTMHGLMSQGLSRHT